MASLGEILTKEREAKGLSIDEASKATKIQPKFIKALEQEDFQLIPAPIYLKGFLRTYAQYLELDQEEILSLYKETWARSELAKKPISHGKKYPLNTTHSSQKYLITALFIIFTTAALVYYFYHTGIQKQEKLYSHLPEKTARIDKPQKESPMLPHPQSPQEPILTLEQKPEPSASPTIQPPQRTIEPTVKTPTHPPETVIPEKQGKLEQVAEDSAKGAKETSQSLHLVLTINAIEDTWLRVSTDGISQEDLLLRTGNSREWKAQEKFVLIIGHVAGTRVKLNGKEIPLPHTKIDVLRDFVLTRKDIPQLEKLGD